MRDPLRQELGVSFAGQVGAPRRATAADAPGQKAERRLHG